MDRWGNKSGCVGKSEEEGTESRNAWQTQEDRRVSSSGGKWKNRQYGTCHTEILGSEGCIDGKWSRETPAEHEARISRSRHRWSSTDEDHWLVYRTERFQREAWNETDQRSEQQRQADVQQVVSEHEFEY